MLIKGSPDIENTFHINNLFPFFIFVASTFFVILHQKYFSAISELKIKEFIDKNFLKIIISFLLLIFLFINL
jgi:hypothetical protein